MSVPVTMYIMVDVLGPDGGSLRVKRAQTGHFIKTDKRQHPVSL